LIVFFIVRNNNCVTSMNQWMCQARNDLLGLPTNWLNVIECSSR
jgi:hypothetical protein